VIDRGKFKALVEKLRKGIRVGELVLVCGEPKAGRFAQEFNLGLFVERGGLREHLLYLKVFLGRGHYRGWVEVFGISPKVCGETYFGSSIEARVLDELSDLTDRLFVEYFEDMETVKELESGVPPALSRLGFEIARRGFPFLRDWYFPEGLMEGGHKLQGEKRGEKDKYLKDLRKSLEALLRGSAREKVVERFRTLEVLWKAC